MEPDTPVSIDTTQPVQQPVSIDTQQSGNPTPSANTSEVRSKKASIGLGQLLGRSDAELYAAIQRGDEPKIRAEAASKLDALNNQNRISNVVDLVKQNNGTLTMDQMDQLLQKPADPNSVIEDNYAKKFLDGIYSAGANIGDTSLDSVSATAPETLKSDMAKGQSAFSNIEYARTKLENVQDLYNNQGWVPWLEDQAKNIIPFYSDVKLRGWMQSVPAFNWQLQGNNLYEQTRALLRLPSDQFKPKLDEILDSLSKDNPTLAVQYANAVVGMSTSDEMLANVNNVIDVTALPGLAKGTVSAIKDINTVRTAIKDGIQGAAKARPGPGQVEEAFGDTATAAVKKSTDVVMSKVDQTDPKATNTTNLNTVNDPIRQAKQSLPTNFQLDKSDIAANPGPLSRELTNRILQQQDVASNRIVDVAQNVARIQRIPLEEATESMMTLIKEEVKNQHPGIKNGILDVGDPVYNPIGNNYNFPVRIGSWTGEQFATEETARRFAAEHGIQEYSVAGKSGAQYFLPEAAVKRSWESQPRLGEVTYKNGDLAIHTDDGARVQLTTKPEIGHIPVTVDQSGKVTFHPTIKSEGDLTKAVTAQQGLGFHLLTWKPLDETQKVIKDLTLSLESTKSVASRGGVEAWLNSTGLGYARSSDNTLSPFEIHQRKTGTYSISNYQKLLQDEMRHVEDIARGRVRVDPVTGQDIGRVRSYLSSLRPGNKLAARERYAEFKRVLDFARDDKHPTTGAVGYFKRSPGELNELYHTLFNRDVTFQEAQGYFAFVRNYENDRVFRSLREYTNKVRLGAEQHQVSFTDGRTGQRIQTKFFDGVTRKELPGGDFPVLDLTGAEPSAKMSSKMGSGFNELAARVRKGEAVVTEVYNSELKPLESIPGMEGRYIKYVVSNSGDRVSKSLDWNQVNRLSGGHFAYDYDHYIKEANVMSESYGATQMHRYVGDKTFMAVNGKAQGKAIINVLNEVKRLLREKDVNGAKQVFQNGLKGDQGPAMEWKEFLARTRPTRVNGVIQPPSININEPFHVVPKGGLIGDLGKELANRYERVRPNGTVTSTFLDNSKSGSLAAQYRVGYTQERDNLGLMAMRAEGTKENPIYKYEPAKFVDPISTMNRALNQIVSSTFMDDMKVTAMEGWLREAEEHLKADTSEIRSSPFYHFNNANDKSAFNSLADKTVVANLMSNRFKIKQFLGVPSKYDAFMHDTASKINDWLFDKMGPKSELVPTWLLTKTTSPIALMRSMAYHAKIGLFALPQILTQMQSYVTIASIAPRSAVGGTWAATLHQWSKFASAPEHFAALEEKANAVNLPGFHKWKPGFFNEARQELNNRGFANVGGEYSTLNTQLKHQYIKGDWGAFLDLGQTFFKSTEQHVRYGAWYTAALEYQAEHPNIKVMSRTDWDKVLDRADDLSGNMSRASSSILQSGPLSLTGQFLTYQMHLAELFWGKRIGGETGSAAAARLRMYTAYSLLFGAPMGIGITGAPVADYFRKAAIDNGYVVGDNWMQSAVMEGLPAVFAAWATSDSNDISKGNWYNVSKLGSGGFTQLNNLWSSDAKFWEVVGGASTSIMANSIKNASGFVRGMVSMLPGSSEDQAFPMKLDDMIDVAKEVTSVNQAWKATVAIQTGKWLSKNEAYQSDVSKANAVFMAATGLDLTQAADNYNIGQMFNDQTEQQKYALNRFTREFRRGVMAADNNDWDSYNSYMTRAFTYMKVLDYPEDKMQSAIAIASKGYETRINAIREEFYTKNVPAGKEEQRMDAYTRFLRTQDK